MARGDFPRRRCNVILVGWWIAFATRTGAAMKFRVRSFAVALEIAVPIVCEMEVAMEQLDAC
jgi:hypothetical protein